MLSVAFWHTQQVLYFVWVLVVMHKDDIATVDNKAADRPVAGVD